jgi:hypothetical protein
VGDWYLDVATDSSRRYYRIEIWAGRDNEPWRLVKSSGGTGRDGLAIDHRGGYPNIKAHVAALPLDHEHAFTRVRIFNSAGVAHGVYESNVVYYLT